MASNIVEKLALVLKTAAVAVWEEDLNAVRFGPPSGKEEALRDLTAVVAEVKAAIERGEVYTFEVIDNLEAAGVLLGTHERQFAGWICTAEDCGKGSSYYKDQPYCSICGRRMLGETVVVVKVTPEVRHEPEPLSLWPMHRCSVCGDKTAISEKDQIRFCSKDGGRLERIEWHDSLGQTWSSSDRMERAEQHAKDLDGDARALVLDLSSGAWDSRKQSSKLIREYVEALLKAATAEVSEDEFVSGVRARAELIKEGALRLLSAWIEPAKMIFDGLGVPMDAKEVRGEVKAVGDGVEKVLAFVDKVLVMATTSTAFVEGMVIGYTLVVDFCSSVCRQMGMTEEEALAEALERAFGKNGGNLQLLHFFDKVCQWGKNGIPHKEGMTIN